MSRAVPPEANAEEQPFPAQLLDGTEVLIAEKLPGVPGGPPVLRGVDGSEYVALQIPGAVAKVEDAGDTHQSAIDYVSTRAEQ